ncbi:MAG TPA: hypothetical protein VFA06_03090 [Actinocrinis sp.]|uniref:hypothetical protein n=1 Tax=Actinocrinis sp. TaxID=1920516 RepID=UPI002D4DB8E2|nr:hypothetical protein [Actinocrinis sp.]HZU54834.1 hypothetical protein [Actinocrinis sp.]
MPDATTTATDAPDAGARIRALIESLLRQAADYDEFGDKVGGDLGPHYKDLARALRCRVAVLLGPYGLAAARKAQPAASLKPRDSREIGEAARAYVELLTARREGIDDDGARLLAGRDPGPVLWVAVTAMTSLLNKVSEESAQDLMSRWGVTAANLAEGVTTANG